MKPTLLNVQFAVNSGDERRRTELKIGESRGENDANRGRHTKFAAVVDARGKRCWLAAQPHRASRVAHEAVGAGPVLAIRLRTGEAVGGGVVGDDHWRAARIAVV
jgi:hypothetical protein